MRFGALLAVLVAAAAIAGCSSPHAPVSKPGAEGPSGDAQVRGVVVSPAIVPLGNVSVRLEPAGKVGVTAANGSFAFTGLTEGAYTIEVSKATYRNATVAVQASPGSRIVQVVLDPDPRVGAFYEAYAFDGFLQESFNVAGARQNTGGSPNYTIGERAPDLIQMELTWDSTQALGDWLDLTAIANDGNVTVPDIGHIDGPSPLVLTINSSIIQQYKLGPKVYLDTAVFAGQQPAAADRGYGLVVDQGYRMITHMFYGYLPPEGWAFTKDGEPPSPP